ncbi:MAG: mevalonate kinase family protein [Chitinophagales bacterium]
MFASFSSKILLFGEYSIVAGGKALAIPYSKYQGHFAFADAILKQEETIKKSQEVLQKLQLYIANLAQKNQLLCVFDTQKMALDLAKDLYFHSNIPQGYGLGSSGALIAALYENYVSKKIILTKNETAIESSLKCMKLKQIFAQIENFFHGQSSGIDPLICYLNKAVIIEGKKRIKTIELPHFEAHTNTYFFLLNTNKTRQTSPLVHWFLEQLKDETYKLMCEQKLVEINENCIQHFLHKENDFLLENMKQLSALQFQHFRKMIPDFLLEKWKSGLENEDYFLKICGAGGGGFMLGITKNIAQTKKIFEAKNLQIVFQF